MARTLIFSKIWKLYLEKFGLWTYEDFAHGNATVTLHVHLVEVIAATISGGSSFAGAFEVYSNDSSGLVHFEGV